MRRCHLTDNSIWKRLAIIAAMSVLAVLCSNATARDITVSLSYNFSSLDVESGSEHRLYQLMKENPGLKITEWSGISLPAGSGRASLMMAIAGNAGPDLFTNYLEQIRNDADQRLIHPLNEWIGKDKNGNGWIDPDEATWPEWKRIPALWRQIATVNGKIYALPIQSPTKYGIVYRKDIARKAGLDPSHPPKTWDDFLYWCQKMTDPKHGRTGFSFLPSGGLWVPWMQSAGGTPIMQIKRSPKTGKEYRFDMDASTFRTPDTGEDLSGVPSQWRAAFASDAGSQALAFYHKLRWQRWIRVPGTNEPINLTDKDIANGSVVVHGRKITFAKSDVITGCVRPALAGFAKRGAYDMLEWLTKGEIGMMEIFIDNLPALGTINTDLLATFPIPAGPGGKRVVMVTQNFLVMSSSVGSRPKDERDMVWKTMSTLTDMEAYNSAIRSRVMSGMARFLSPDQLISAGMGSYLSEIPQDSLQIYAGLKSHRIVEKTPPFVGFWGAMDLGLDQNVISPMLSPSGENFNYKVAVRDLQQRANEGGMFKRPEKEMRRYRPAAWGIFAFAGAFVIAITVLLVRAQIGQRKESTAGVFRGWMPWIMLAPALETVLLWGYYPLARGLTMAFQDYHLLGKSVFVGLDNFISIFLNPDFYIYIAKTFKFVLLNLALAFFAPIFLALLLSEVPRAKTFWRTIYFLPQLSSGLVITLLWKMMYDPTPNGVLNKVLGMIHLTPQDWLGNPKLAMASTIVPGIWAGAGIASLIYLAALKSVPEEIYEAADVDGGGIWAKIKHITAPTILPLILINFVGAFIGTFQGMGNIFLLTFGGPGKETMVMSMAVWIEAYNNLNFSIATSLAWIMGSALIGFTYLQIRMLDKVEFKQAKGV